MAVARDLDVAERLERGPVNAVVAVTYDRSVNAPGYNQGQRVGCGSKDLLDARVVKQAERDVQRLSEATVGVVADLSGMDDDANPELVRETGPGKTCVVVG